MTPLGPVSSPMQVAIVGGAPSWQRAPWGRSDWQVWAHASIHEGVKPREADLWFDVHLPSVRAEPKSWAADYDAWLNGQQGRTAPVVVQDAEPRPPNTVVLPRAEIAAWLASTGYDGGEYVTSSASWMLLYALMQGATRVGFWGINFEDTAEYRIQRPCLEHWIGFARGRGVAVYITPTSRLTRDAHVYGFDGHRQALLDAHGALAPGTAVRLTPALVRQGRLPAVAVTPAMQALIDEERELFGVDTVARFRTLIGADEVAPTA